MIKVNDRVKVLASEASRAGFLFYEFGMKGTVKEVSERYGVLVLFDNGAEWYVEMEDLEVITWI